jgi:oligopeptidase B
VDRRGRAHPRPADRRSERTLAFDDPVHSVEIGLNPEYHSTTVRFVYESLVTPLSVYEEDVTTGDRQLLKRLPVLGGYDPAQYESAREWATAPDGTRVPVDVVWRRGTPRDGTAPLSLYGYGAYEYSAAAVVRGRAPLVPRPGRGLGARPPSRRGELGRAWYLDGKLLNKRNTFTDFIACAEHLVEKGYGSRSRVTARGGSAGGLLVGACLTLRPDLYAAVIAAVPFVDVVTTMRDRRSRLPSPSGTSGATLARSRTPATCSATRPTTTWPPVPATRPST